MEVKNCVRDDLRKSSYQQKMHDIRPNAEKLTPHRMGKIYVYRERIKSSYATKNSILLLLKTEGHEISRNSKATVKSKININSKLTSTMNQLKKMTDK